MLAHIRRFDGAEQSLSEHIRNVSTLCRRFAKPLGLEKTAELIGLMHDMGKATKAFAAYLRHSFTATEKLSSPHPHAPTGAIYAYRRWFQKENASKPERTAAQCVSLCILGHHAGLCDCLDQVGLSPYVDAMTDEKNLRHYDEAADAFLSRLVPASELDALFADACTEISAFLSRISQGAKGKERPFQLGMLCRLLLSILVDADRWDTACFAYGQDALAEEPEPDWQRLLDTFDAYRMTHLSGTGKINQVRASISDACTAHAADAPGIVTLSVPTGGGKTFSSLRYALQHARHHQHHRIFYIIPYNTILDQNAKDIREALRDDPCILEHHANVVIEPSEGKTLDEEEADYKRLTERWDSRIILTSLVQFLNACYTSSNTDARRLHRLTNAILIFDEIQSLPKRCKTLFEWAIHFLSTCCGCTVVLCTATQPRLALRPEPAELMPDVEVLYAQLKRVRYVPALDNSRTFASAAARIAQIIQEQSVLTIVNTRAAAYTLYTETKAILEEGGTRFAEVDPTLSDADLAAAVQAIPEDRVLCLYLSTLLCPAHRKRLISWMKACLKAGRRVACFSTALIEAGINVSFPVVIRSLTGLPSIVQAAGRANRNMEYGEGIVHIWDFSDENVSRLADIQNGANITRGLLSEDGFAKLLDMPNALGRYFADEERYIADIINYPLEQNKGTTLSELLSGNNQRWTAACGHKSTQGLTLTQSFRTAGDAFEVIPQNTKAVLVPYLEGRDIIAALNGRHDMQEEIRLLRAAQAYSVSLFDQQYKKLEHEGALFPVGESGTVAVAEGYYDACAGLLFEMGTLDFLES